jgi:hypothetical protein
MCNDFIKSNVTYKLSKIRAVFSWGLSLSRNRAVMSKKLQPTLCYKRLYDRNQKTMITTNGEQFFNFSFGRNFAECGFNVCSRRLTLLCRNVE